MTKTEQIPAMCQRFLNSRKAAITKSLQLIPHRPATTTHQHQQNTLNKVPPTNRPPVTLKGCHHQVMHQETPTNMSSTKYQPNSTPSTKLSLTAFIIYKGAGIHCAGTHQTTIPFTTKPTTPIWHRAKSSKPPLPSTNELVREKNLQKAY